MTAGRDEVTTMIYGGSDSGDGLVLRLPRTEDETAARQAREQGLNFGRWITDGQSWARYLDRLAKDREGVDLSPGMVRSTLLYADVCGRMVGRALVRHRLNDALLATGGHVGFGVLPQFRCRGHATEILCQALGFLQDLGVGRVLVTCRDDNVGSIKVIERCGGRRDPEWPTSLEGFDRVTRRYWIERRAEGVAHHLD
jgi:predicted acetyltransferase